MGRTGKLPSFWQMLYPHFMFSFFCLFFHFLVNIKDKMKQIISIARRISWKFYSFFILPKLVWKAQKWPKKTGNCHFSLFFVCFFLILRTKDEILLSKVFLCGKHIKDRASAENLVIFLNFPDYKFKYLKMAKWKLSLTFFAFYS